MSDTGYGSKETHTEARTFPQYEMTQMLGCKLPENIEPVFFIFLIFRLCLVLYRHLEAIS